MNGSQQGCLHQLLMFSSASVNLIGVHWSHWSASTWWLDCYDMCLISFSWCSVIYCTLTSFRAQLSQLGFWRVVNWSVDYGLHSVNLDSLIQFEWPPWEFKFLGIHASGMIIVLYHHSFIWLYKASTSIAAPFCQFYAYLSEFFVRLCFQFLDYYDKLIWSRRSQQDEA